MDISLLFTLILCKVVKIVSLDTGNNLRNFSPIFTNVSNGPSGLNLVVHDAVEIKEVFLETYFSTRVDKTYMNTF